MPQYLSPGVYVEEVPPLARPIAGVGTSTAGFVGVIPDTIQIPAKATAGDSEDVRATGFKFIDFVCKPAGEPFFISSWSQFTKLFGDFVGDENEPATEEANPEVNPTHTNLAHAVYGFFNNGGTGCYVVRVAKEAEVVNGLKVFAAIDEIAIVAAPGLTGTVNYNALMDHCSNLQDRFAVLDPVESDTKFENGDFTKLQKTTTNSGLRPTNSDYAAFYFPWLTVFDPALKLMNSDSDGFINVAPSGHISGIYSRSDGARGVFKAPANEPVKGVTGLKWSLSKSDQDQLNDDGVNIIRSLNGAIRVWGARTIGGDANGEYKYISTRRYFNFLRESIDQGTQFVVFEPNSPDLWQRITRTVSDFLLNQWRDGALFGDTPQQAYFVKCDHETNPPEVREAGQVVTEIGVAIVKPAEFVIFRIQQTTGS